MVSTCYIFSLKVLFALFCRRLSLAFCERPGEVVRDLMEMCGKGGGAGGVVEGLCRFDGFDG